jgi:hypothetical protein
MVRLPECISVSVPESGVSPSMDTPDEVFPPSFPHPRANPPVPGPIDRPLLPCDRISSALELAEAGREQGNASDRPFLARALAMRSHFTPPKTTTRLSRLRRRCDRLSWRRAVVGFRWAA